MLSCFNHKAISHGLLELAREFMLAWSMERRVETVLYSRHLESFSIVARLEPETII